MHDPPSRSAFESPPETSISSLGQISPSDGCRFYYGDGLGGPITNICHKMLFSSFSAFVIKAWSARSNSMQHLFVQRLYFTW
jgi:hypothetical protein